jgi:hypothetical protein
MSMVEIYTWREIAWGTTDLTGFEVEATDGGIGKVDEDTKHVQTLGFLVVDTGPWIFGKKVMLPAGAVTAIDHDDGKVFVDRMKDEIKDAPEFDQDRFRDEKYRTQVGDYYRSRLPGRTTTPR